MTLAENRYKFHGTTEIITLCRNDHKQCNVYVHDVMNFQLWCHRTVDSYILAIFSVDTNCYEFLFIGKIRGICDPHSFARLAVSCFIEHNVTFERKCWWPYWFFWLRLLSTRIKKHFWVRGTIIFRKPGHIIVSVAQATESYNCCIRILLVFRFWKEADIFQIQTIFKEYGNRFVTYKIINSLAISSKYIWFLNTYWTTSIEEFFNIRDVPNIEHVQSKYTREICTVKCRTLLETRSGSRCRSAKTLSYWFSRIREYLNSPKWAR